ncbi:MAG: hypothetical protein JXR13_17405 [Thalassovita sp.]
MSENSHENRFHVRPSDFKDNRGIPSSVLIPAFVLGVGFSYGSGYFLSQYNESRGARHIFSDSFLERRLEELSLISEQSADNYIGATCCAVVMILIFLPIMWSRYEPNVDVSRHNSDEKVLTIWAALFLLTLMVLVWVFWPLQRSDGSFSKHSGLLLQPLVLFFAPGYAFLGSACLFVIFAPAIRILKNMRSVDFKYY